MTDPTMVGLNALMEVYRKNTDFVTLLFPANEFFAQESYDPNKPEELLNELKHVRPGHGYEPLATQIFTKIHVNGENEAPYYTFFKNSCPNTAAALFPSYALNYAPQRAKDVFWNYEKFLIARNGSVYARYSSAVFLVSELALDIEHLLNQKA